MRAETALAGPEEVAETRSQTSRMSSQFSEVRFSSVALTVCGLCVVSRLVLLWMHQSGN